MKEYNHYKFNTARLINIWLLPVLSMSFMFVVLNLKSDTLQNLSGVDILAFSLFFIFLVGVFIFLFINHLSIALRTELILSRKTFEIIKNKKSYKCDLSEITEVIEYSTARLPWSSIIKWKLKVADKEIVISSLTISKLNFERYFHDKTEEKISVFPRV